MYSPLPNAKPELKFSEKNVKPGANVELQREKAEKVIANIGLKDPWHKMVRLCVTITQCFVMNRMR